MQLRAHKSLDLLALEYLVARMTGIEVVHGAELTEGDLRSMGGGDTLRSYSRTSDTSGSGAALTSARKKAISRLIEALESEGVTAPLLILIAQQREAILFSVSHDEGFDPTAEARVPLKLTGHLYDMCTDVLLQFSDFLSSHLSPLRFAAVVPSLAGLHTRFHVEPVIAFHLVRHIVRAATKELALAEEQVELLSSQAEAAEVASSGSSGKPDAADSSPSKSPQASIESAQARLAAAQQSPWLLTSTALREQAVLLMDSDTSGVDGEDRPKDHLSAALYAAFWTLSLYDIFTPRAEYDAAIARVKERRAELQRGPDEGMTPKKQRLEVARLGEVADRLQKELQEQLRTQKRTREFLVGAKDSWFPESSASSASVMQLLQVCILPRALFSPEDALYSARFIDLLHRMDVPGFSTLACYRGVLELVTSTLVCITEREAGNLAIFMREVLHTLLHWSSDSKTFAKECAGKRGFALTTSTGKGNVVGTTSFSEFCSSLDSWMDCMARTFTAALKSSNYMHVRQSPQHSQDVGWEQSLSDYVLGCSACGRTARRAGTRRVASGRKDPGGALSGRDREAPERWTAPWRSADRAVLVDCFFLRGWQGRLRDRQQVGFRCFWQDDLGKRHWRELECVHGRDEGDDGCKVKRWWRSRQW